MDKDITIPLTRTLTLLERGVVLEDMAQLTTADVDAIISWNLVYDPDECAFLLDGKRWIQPSRLTSIEEDIEVDEALERADYDADMRQAGAW